MLLLSLPPGCMGLLALTTDGLSVSALPPLSPLFRRLLAVAERWGLPVASGRLSGLHTTPCLGLPLLLPAVSCDRPRCCTLLLPKGPRGWLPLGGLLDMAMCRDVAAAAAEAPSSARRPEDGTRRCSPGSGGGEAAASLLPLPACHAACSRQSSNTIRQAYLQSWVEMQVSCVQQPE